MSDEQQPAKQPASSESADNTAAAVSNATTNSHQSYQQTPQQQNVDPAYSLALQQQMYTNALNYYQNPAANSGSPQVNAAAAALLYQQLQQQQQQQQQSAAAAAAVNQQLASPMQTQAYNPLQLNNVANNYAMLQYYTQYAPLLQQLQQQQQQQLLMQQQQQQASAAASAAALYYGSPYWQQTTPPAQPQTPAHQLYCNTTSSSSTSLALPQALHDGGEQLTLANSASLAASYTSSIESRSESKPFTATASKPPTHPPTTTASVVPPTTGSSNLRETLALHTQIATSEANRDAASGRKVRRRRRRPATVGDMIDRLAEFERVRTLLGSKNLACAALGCSKGTVNFYITSLKHAEEMGYTVDKMRDTKFKELKSLLGSSRRGSRKHRTTSTADASSNATGSSVISEVSPAGVTSGNTDESDEMEDELESEYESDPATAAEDRPTSAKRHRSDSTTSPAQVPAQPPAQSLPSSSTATSSLTHNATQLYQQHAQQLQQQAASQDSLPVTSSENGSHSTQEQK